MQILLKEVLEHAKEVATQANDEELLEEQNRLIKIISQSSYRKYNLEDMQTIWHIADIGDRTCDMLLEQAESPEQLEKTAEVQIVYQDIKKLVEDSVSKDRESKRSVIQIFDKKA